MFSVYLDDSGTDPNQHVAIATGLIIPALQIRKLEQEWDAFKRKEHFSEFHTSPFVFSKDHPDFSQWDKPKKKKVFNRVRQITKKYGITAFSVAINKEDYDEVVPLELRRMIGEYHYTWAVHHLVSLLREWRTSRPKLPPPFKYIFSWMEPKGKQRDAKQEIEAAMERAEAVAIEDGRDGEFTNYSFRHPKEIPGLQCVDAVAWVSYQFSLFAFRDKPLHEFAGVGWNDFGGPLEHEGWLKAIAIRREHLKNWAHQVLADPRNVETFTRAEARRLELKAKKARK